MNTRTSSDPRQGMDSVTFKELKMPVVASPEPEAPPAPEAPQTRPSREDPRYPAHTPPAPEHCPHPVDPLPDDESYPACKRWDGGSR